MAALKSRTARITEASERWPSRNEIPAATNNR
jgi:hypothetical protein